MEEKYEEELGYWKKGHVIEGNDAFNKTESLKNNIFDRYCDYLNLNEDSFKDKVILDIGCGPRGSLHFFNAKLKFGLDPLSKKYQKNFNIIKQDMIYLNSESEDIPLVDNFVDVVLSVNALDHVKDIIKTLDEIKRILRPGGGIIFEINFNDKATICEPFVFNEEVLKSIFEDKFDYNIVRILDSDDIHKYKRAIVKGRVIK